MWASVLCLLAAAGTAGAFITKIYPLKDVLSESTHVLVGRLEKVDAVKRTAEASIGRALKGKREYRRIRMNLGVGPGPHVRYLLERMKPGAEIVVFYRRQGKNIACVCHTGGTWFQLFATDNPKARDKVWWRFTHVEIHMPRTFDGPTDKLARLVADVLAKRTQPPGPDPKAPAIDVNRRPPRQVKVADAAGKRGGFHRQVRIKFARRDGEMRGISWADVNGDEMLDAYLCRQGGNVLLVNQHDGFKDMTSAMGLSGGSRAGAWADYNGDGHPDLLTNNFQLFTHVGGKFRNDSKLLRPPKGRNPEGAGWIDYNGDGRPDILITNGEHGIRLYENTGRGPKWFRDVSDKAGLGRKGLGAGNGDFVVILDYDGDGRPDFLYNLADGVLAHNTGRGRFKPDTRSGIRLPGRSATKRGVAVADIDNDGDVDLFVPGGGRAALYRNNNDGTFTDVIARAGDLGKANAPSFAAAVGDVNGDGNLDLFVCHTKGPNRLYLGDGRGRFKDVTAEVGLKRLLPAWAASLADIDGDGDLDLVANLQDRVVLAINDMPRPPGRAPLIVRVRARRGRTGAVVRAFDAKGKPVGLRELNGGEGCGGQAVPVAHFGAPLGRCRVSVCLSDGRAARKTVTVKAKGTQVAFGETEFK